MTDLSEFIKISQKLGSDIAFVQAGGGNTSQKIDSEIMAVKSSGSFLRDIAIDKGYCLVNFKKIKQFHNDPPKEESKYTKKMSSFVIKGDGRPSMEAGFHAIIPKKYVLHSHPVYLNVLLCSEQGHKALVNLYPKSIFIKTVAPGKDLSIEILSAINKEFYDGDYVFFLQNHGLITASDDINACYTLHLEISNSIKAEHELDTFNYKDFQDINPTLFKNNLFPDQIIFSKQRDTKSPGYTENFSAANYILNQINALQLTPLFLSDDLTNSIASMDAEKYRFKLYQK